MHIPSLTYKTNLLITAPKIDTDFLWDLATLFVILAVLYLIGVFFYNYKISATAKKVGDRKRELSPMVSEFLFLEEDATKDEKSNYIALKIEIRELLKDPFNRRVLSEILLDLRRDVSGEAQQSLFALYQDLGLDKDAFSKLKSWRWQVISKGILELTQMEVAESYSFVTKFINDKRSTIRKQAEIATVTLRHEGINYFLDTTRYKISEWQQLKLLDVLRNQKDFRPPRFKSWLTSNNKYVVLFALRLIKFYNQNDAGDSLIELVKHKNNQIKEEAIACIKEFNITEALDTLKLVFWNCSVDIKIAILGAVGEIGTTGDLEFLELIDKKELNFSVKSKAISSINAIAPETIMPSKGIQDASHYGIPKDLSQKAVEKYAEKHEDISHDKADVLENNPIEGELEEVQSIHITPEVDVPPTPESETEVALKEENNDEEIENKMDLSDEMDAKTGMNVPDVLHIEVRAEEVTGSGQKETQLEPTPMEWSANHLDFLPIVTEETETALPTAFTTSSDQTSIPTNDSLFEIKVVYEECLPEAHTESEERASFYDEFDMAEFAFLPIVVENELDHQEVPSEKMDTGMEKNEIRSIEVQYDHIVSNTSEEITALESDSEVVKIPSAPIGVPEDGTGVNQEIELNVDYGQYSSDEIRNMDIVFEQVSEVSGKTDLWDIEVVHTHEFSENKSKPVEEADDIELPVENERMLQEILDDLFVTKDLSVENEKENEHENVQDEEPMMNPDWDLDEDELHFIPVFFEKKESEDPSFIRIETSNETPAVEESSIPKASIPKAIFGDIEFEASTRQLLNDLEEMGDEREIPFLKELLTHEKYDAFKDRINELIDLFNHSKDKAEEQVDHPLQPFSVFQDLFRTCDTEAKLILLNEVVAVGDEKEIHFLEALTQDESPEIRKKALSVLKKLKKKLNWKDQKTSPTRPTDEVSEGHMNLSEMPEVEDKAQDSDPNDIFDLNFDFPKPSTEDDSEKKKDDEIEQASFLGQICQLSTKIMEKLNG